jgi:hypothetical protein
MRLCKSLATRQTLRLPVLSKILSKPQRHRLSEADRLQKYFWDLEKVIPNPPANWAVNAKECKWAKILKERKDNPDVSGE